MTYHPERMTAQKQYDIALAAARKAEDVSEEAFLVADAKLAAARIKLIEMERKHPLGTEVKRQNRKLWLANTGHDIF